MIRDLKWVVVGIAAACAAFTTAAHAGDTVNVELIQSGMVSTTSYPITPDRRDLIFGVSEWDVPQPDDRESPLHGLQGTCFGVTEFDGDTIVGGGGYCTYTDADADRLVTRWTPIEQVLGTAPGTRGEWQVVEGSGKWEGSTGSGTSLNSRVGDGGERRRELRGTITLR